MGASILVSEIIEEARIRLAYPAFGATTFITSTASLNIMKFSCRRLSALIRRAFGSEYFTARTTLTTTADDDTVALPSNFSDMRQIAWVRGDDDVIPMEMAVVDEWAASGATARAWDGAPKYRIKGSELYLIPKPNQEYTLSLYYDTGIYITATSDSIDIQPGWEEWLINDFCIRVRMAEDLESSAFERERAIAEASILQQAAQRDRVGVHVVRDLWDMDEAIDPRSLYARR